MKPIHTGEVNTIIFNLLVENYSCKILHDLPRLRDSLSYLYFEYAILEKRQQAIETLTEAGRTLIPTADLSVLLLGSGTSISHAAIGALARTCYAVVWVGQEGTSTRVF